MAAFHPKQTLKNAVLFGFCSIAELPVLPVGLRPCLRRDTGSLSKNLSAAEAGVSSLSAVAPSPLFRTRLPLSLRHCEHSRTFGRGTGFPRARARTRWTVNLANFRAVPNRTKVSKVTPLEQKRAPMSILSTCREGKSYLGRARRTASRPLEHQLCDFWRERCAPGTDGRGKRRRVKPSGGWVQPPRPGNCTTSPPADSRISSWATNSERSAWRNGLASRATDAAGPSATFE